MNFEAIDFSRLSEADVREEIIAPLLRHLGYRSSTNNDVIRGQSLRYPRVFIGRKNPNRDPILRGSADYICDVEKKVRWVIEAKSSDVDIGPDEIEQAYTYASHPEVRAVYFCVTNGREFKFYQTNQGPEAQPILSVKYEEMNKSLQIIENLLSPVALLRDHPAYVLDIGKPIGPGLRSVVRLTGGHIIYNRSNPDVPQLRGLTVTIEEGAVERDEQQRLVVFLRARVPYQSLQNLNERLGLSDFETISEDEVVSIDPAKPTVFTATRQIVLPRGERILNLQTWQEIPLPVNITMSAQTSASGVLSGNQFKGTFRVAINMREIPSSVQMMGDFVVNVS